MDSKSNGLFNGLRPLCVELTNVVMEEESVRGKNAILPPLKALDVQLKLSICEELNIDTIKVEDSGQWDVISPKLADYIMFPISELLKRPNLMDTDLEHLLSIIRTLVITCWSNHFDSQLFNQLLPLVTFLIGGRPNEFNISNSSNETLNNGVDIIRGLLTSCQNTTTMDSTPLKSQEMIPTIGHLISVLLNLASQCKDLDVKLSSLKSLNLIYHQINDGEILSLMFPGNVSTFAKIIKSNPHSRVIGELFITFTTLSNLIFNDLDLGIIDTEISLDELKEMSIDDLELNDEVKIREVKIGQHRTSSWLTATISQFEKGLKIILNLNDSTVMKPNVKDPLFQFNIKMVRNSFLACSKLIPLNLKSLSQLCQIDPSFIDQTCESFLYCFHGNEIQIKCLAIMEDELNNMNFILNSPNSDKIIEYLNYLNLLLRIIIEVGDESPKLVIESLIKKLILNVSQMVKVKSMKDLKIQNKKLIEPIETQMLLVSKDYMKGEIDIEDNEQVSLFDKIFIKDVETNLSKLLKSIADSDLTGFNLNDNNTDEFESSVYIWVLTEIISNVKPKVVDEFLDFGSDGDDDDTNGSGNQLLELHYQILDKSIENLGNSVSEFPVLTSLKSINSNLKYFGGDFKEELINVLYPVVECLSSNNERVRMESQITITNLSTELYGGSISEMLKDNMDYLIDSISNKLISDSITPRILIILNVLIKIGSIDILKELSDIITALFTLLDLHYNYDSLVSGIFLIFNEILNQIYKKYEIDFGIFETVDDDIDYHHGVWNLKSMDDVNEFVGKEAIVPDDLLNFEEETEEQLKKSKILEIDSDDESESEDEIKSIPQSVNGSDEDEHEKWESPIEPKVYSIIVNIFEYGERLMQMTNTNNVIIILKLLKRIIPLLSTEKRKFLPIAVKIWEKLIFNLNATQNLTVISLTLENLIEIIRYLNTFMASRFIDLFTFIKNNKFINEVIISKYSTTKVQRSTAINRTSVSMNMNLETFNKICALFLLGLNKMGRYLPNDVGISIIQITLAYDNDPSHYGYFDNHVRYMIDYNERQNL